MPVTGPLPEIDDVAVALASTDQVDIPGVPLDLHTYPPVSGIYTITSEILNMFRSNLNQGMYAERFAYQYFENAKRVYQDVMRYNAPFAVFYRIKDRKRVEDIHAGNLEEIKNDFVDYFNRLGRLSGSEVTDFFRLHSDILELMPRPLSEDNQTKLDIIIRLQTPTLSRAQLATDDVNDINGWFTDRLREVETLAREKFYGVANFSFACQEGTIYSPGMDHNWGVNFAWALAVSRKGIPIHILCPLNIQDIERSHPTPNPHGGGNLYTENPSAFALEISVAIQNGYFLNFTGATPSLARPTPDLYIHTDGTPGRGMFPAKSTQLDTFRACVLQQINQNGTLSPYVNRICTIGDDNQKKDLIHGLNFLAQRNEALPLLSKLSSQDHHALRVVLTAASYRGENFDDLRRMARDVQFAILTDLTTKSDEDLRNHIHAVCTGASLTDKQDLIGALITMPIASLDKLSEREIVELQTVLEGGTFIAAKYEALRMEVNSRAPPPPGLFFSGGTSHSVGSFLGSSNPEKKRTLSTSTGDDNDDPGAKKSRHGPP